MTPMVLPIQKPFYLLQYKVNGCQKIAGMTIKMEDFHFDDEDSHSDDSCGGAHPYDEYCGGNHRLHFCYYSRATKSDLSNAFG